MRTFWGIVGGAVFGAIVAAAIPALFLGIVMMFARNMPPDDQAQMFRWGPTGIAFCSACGAMVGALAGLASRLPRSGYPLLRCCTVIAIATGVTRLLTAPSPNVSEADQYYFSYIASLIAAVVATTGLVAIAARRAEDE